MTVFWDFYFLLFLDVLKILRPKAYATKVKLTLIFICNKCLKYLPFLAVSGSLVQVVSNRHGGLAQLGERLPYKQRVTGSSPVSSISLRPLSLRAFF